MLTISQLGKSYGDRVLFGDVSLNLNPGARYGLVGANGSGKTTFLRVVAGDEPATDGMVAFPSRARIGVLRQDHFLDDNRKILDVAMMGDATVFAALEERTRIVDHGDGDAMRLADLEDTLATLDGYTLEARGTAVLEGLGIPAVSHQQPLSTLSGGFKLRVLLAQVLLGGPDVLLLDEPTNHLDILSIRWLEKFLAGYRGVAVIISHDQRFLDNVATHILDVDYETITAYTGNYTTFTKEKQATRDRKEAQITRTEKIIADKRAFVERFGAKATKAKQAQSRLKQIEKIEVEELARSSRRTPLFQFVQERPSGRDVMEVDGVSKSYGPKDVLRNVSLTVRRGEKVAVIGPNGLGKSTLLKIVMGVLTADDGKARWGHEVRPGYFAQDHHEILKNESMTLLEYLADAVPAENNAYIRSQLGRVLFSGDEVHKSIGSLSGGEAARLVFGRIIASRPNVLILDEPTNHLDLEAISALVEGLRAYEGTVLFVSHDRWFVSQLASRIVEVTPQGLRDFPGTYPEYLAHCGDDHLDSDSVVLKAKSTAASERGSEKVAVATSSWEEQKRKRNRRKALPGLRDSLLAEIAAAEARRKVIASGYEKDNFFETHTPAQITALEKEDQQLASKIEARMAEWEQVEVELAEEESASS